MQTIYIEKAVLDHTRTKRILSTVKKPYHIIECDNYKEVFNPKAQNFRIQKQNPCIILAQKLGTKLLPIPTSFGVGGVQNYYFSHMLNCLYDCRYCFLQGMYSSAHYVIFVNYEDFMHEVGVLAKASSAPVYFFSGYDCDSLAFESLTHFVKEFLPFFKTEPNALLELRTKSTNVKELLRQEAFNRCIVAFSFTPIEISSKIEHKVPSVPKRLNALKLVADHGWPIGLRFDPLIYHADFKVIYKNLIDSIFRSLDANKVHSVSIGSLRFPKRMYQKIVELYPNDELLSQPLHRKDSLISYPDDLENRMKSEVIKLLTNYIEPSLLFECQV